jgi:hypothetical protein
MPIGSTCRACGAALRPDLQWCGACYARVTTFAARPPIHEPGSYVGTPRPDVRTSRWRAGATTMGPVGRVVATVLLLVILPWWALALPLRSIWRKTRMTEGTPPSALDRFRERHPVLGRDLRLGPTAKVAVVAVAAGAGLTVWLSMDTLDRLVWIGVIVVVAGGLLLAGEHDL